MAITNSLCGSNVEVDLQSNGGALNIGTAAASTVVTIGNSTGASTVNILAGSGNININTAVVDSYTFIGNASNNSGVQIHTGGQGVLFNGSGAWEADVNSFVANLSGSFGFKITNGGGGFPFIVTNGTGAIDIGTDAFAKTITVGNTTGATALIFNTGSAGISIPSFTTTGALVSDASGLISDANASTAGFVLTSNGAGSVPTFQVSTGGGLQWINVVSSTQAMSVAQGYISNDGASLVTLTLPSTASVGDIVAVQGAGSGLWTIAQNAGQIINFNAISSTTGVTGSVSSTSQYDSIYLMCIITNSTWVVQNSVGNLNVI